MKYNVLIVEDDVDINHLLVQMLEPKYHVISAFSGTEAKLLLDTVVPDIILLDLMIPGMAGEELLSYIRNVKQEIVPVIVISAKAGLDDKVTLLRSGADDYITKPFEPDEVCARIEVVLRRVVSTGGNPNTFEYRDFVLFPEYRKILLHGVELNLTAHEYSLLAFLIENPGKVYSRDALYAQVWGSGYYGENNTINVHVSNIRKKLQEITTDDYIQTVYGIGFKLQ